MPAMAAMHTLEDVTDFNGTTNDDRTRVTVLDYTVKAEVYAEYGADFDPEAVDDAVLVIVNDRLPDGVHMERNGAVYARPDALESARAVDWDALLGSINLPQILADNAR